VKLNGHQEGSKEDSKEKEIRCFSNLGWGEEPQPLFYNLYAGQKSSPFLTH
jgi:hypothetical protein